jgi:hypothetical protein
MSRQLLACAALAALLLPLSGWGCSAQKTEDQSQVAEQAPPPEENGAAQEAAPAPPPPVSHPRTSPKAEHHAPEVVLEERPRRIVPEPPPQPTTVTLTIPKGTSLALSLTEPLSSESAAVGAPVTAELKNPVVVGDRVVFPAGSRVEGRVTDVKSAKKGFKDTGGALAVSFDRIVAPDGHHATIAAGLTRVATGSGKKKGAIIGGSALGAAILGHMLGKDTKGSAVVGGAVGTAVAAGTKGKEAAINPDEPLAVALEQPAQVTVKL